MLAGKDFSKIYNLAGGIMGWQGGAALGAEDLGLALFSGDESPTKTLAVAYSLEDGLRDYYVSMTTRVRNSEVISLFERLALIEVKHQERILEQYNAMTGKALSPGEFETKNVAGVAEGGLTTEEYSKLFPMNLDSAADAIQLAMSIEAQALDLYTRAADKTGDPQSRQALQRLADEERSHLALLGDLLEDL